MRETHPTDSQNTWARFFLLQLVISQEELLIHRVFILDCSVPLTSINIHMLHFSVNEFSKQFLLELSSVTTPNCQLSPSLQGLGLLSD